MKLTKKAMIIPAASLLLLGGCASRVSQFKEFGEAGVKYADTMNKLLSASGELAIDRNSTFLINGRSELSGGDDGNRSKILKSGNELMEERLHILNDIAEHNNLLKLYFKALAELAGSDAGTEITAGTAGIVKKLSELNPRISKATFGEAPIGSLVEPVTDLAVASFQQAALEKELKDHAKIIERELALQVAAIKAIEKNWEYDQKKMLEENRKINLKQFVQDYTLPEYWAENRKAILVANTSPAKLDKSASNAAGELEKAFKTLVTKGDKAKLENIPLIMSDLNKVIDLIELVKKGPSA